MDSIIRWLEKTTKSIGWLSAWFILPLVFSLCYEVFARYMLGRPTSWSYEVSYMLMAAIFLLGAAYTLAEGGHIRIDFLYVKFSPRRQAIVDLIGYIIIFLPVTIVITYSSIKQAVYSFHTFEVSDISPWRPLMWPFRTSIALGFILLTIQVMAEMMKKFVNLFDRKDGGNNG
jgi:TRAP-type mannitol/chloroaromatic compound transport system permease small subunit